MGLEEIREQALSNLMPAIEPDEPAPPPAERREPAGERPAGTERKEKPPAWLEARLRPIQRERNELREKVQELERELSRQRTQPPPAAAYASDLDQEIAALKQRAREDPDTMVDMVERIAELRARKIADTQLAQLSEADAFRSDAMRHTEQAIQLWPEVKDPSSPLAQLANAKWEEAQRARLEGRPSPVLLPEGRYLVIAQAAAELDASRRYDLGGDGEETQRRTTAKRTAGLDTGEGMAGGSRITPDMARRRLAKTRDREEAVTARGVLIDQLIPPNLRE